MLNWKLKPVTLLEQLEKWMKMKQYLTILLYWQEQVLEFKPGILSLEIKPRIRQRLVINYDALKRKASNLRFKAPNSPTRQKNSITNRRQLSEKLGTLP